MISIPKGAKNPELAYKYLAYISQPENNAKLASYITYGPVRIDATEFVAPMRCPNCRTLPTT